MTVFQACMLSAPRFCGGSACTLSGQQAFTQAFVMFSDVYAACIMAGMMQIGAAKSYSKDARLDTEQNWNPLCSSGKDSIFKSVICRTRGDSKPA